jgi:DNA-binding transcriptional LysR family regulator
LFSLGLMSHPSRLVPITNLFGGWGPKSHEFGSPVPQKSKPMRMTISPALRLVSVTQALLVGEYLSFQRAASALGVRQSTVSRRVRQLEDELGVSLFERHRAQVRVTNAGAQFLKQAREALNQLEHAVRTANAAGTGSIGRLSVGILSSMATGFLRDLIQTYCSRHPKVAIQILERASVNNIEAVLKRQLDVAFIRDTSEASGCETLRLWSERVFVVLPEDHALAARKDLGWADLRNEHFIVRQSVDPELRERITTQLTDARHNPSMQTLDVGRETLMNLVSIGFGISLASEATTATSFPKVVFRPIAADDELLHFNAVWLPHNDNPALRRFLALARRMASERQSTAARSGGPRNPPSVTSGISLWLASSLGALVRRLDLTT